MAKPRFFATPAAWRAWLAKNHGNAKELLVGFHKTSTGKPCMTWSESVDEALCFGWIDGVRRRVDSNAYTIRFTPRRPTSIWSAINVDKFRALVKAGKMRPAGKAAFAHRTDARTGVYSFERFKAARFSAAQRHALEDNAKAAKYFAAQPPWYQRVTKHWVASAKQEVTRELRFKKLLAACAAGGWIPQLKRR